MSLEFPMQLRPMGSRSSADTGRPTSSPTEPQEKSLLQWRCPCLAAARVMAAEHLRPTSTTSSKAREKSTEWPERKSLSPPSSITSPKSAHNPQRVQPNDTCDLNSQSYKDLSDG